MPPLPRARDLPFYSFWNEFKAANPEKNLQLVLGLGTSGYNDCEKIIQYISKERSIFKKDAYFVLLIDDVYGIGDRGDTETSRQDAERERKKSLQAVLRSETGASSEPQAQSQVISNYTFQQMENYTKAKDDNNTYIYLWGTQIPSQREIHDISLYNEVRDDRKGPYEYGKQCALGEEDNSVKRFYSPLIEFLRFEHKNIYVFNDAWWETRIPWSTRIKETYQGPKFTDVKRIIHFKDQEEYVRETTEEQRRGGWPRIYTNEYFENFCEMLFSLWKSQKPIYILKESEGMLRGEQIYKQQQEGGKQKRKASRKVKSRKHRKTHKRKA